MVKRRGVGNLSEKEREHKGTFWKRMGSARELFEKSSQTLKNFLGKRVGARKHSVGVDSISTRRGHDERYDWNFSCDCHIRCSADAG